jgi:LacI family transcriptional regulator
MPSIEDVARLAGVSPMTVSRVLNRSAPVKEETKRRVEEAIESLVGFSGTNSAWSKID